MAPTKPDQVNGLTCKPIDTIEELKIFLSDPPPWRSLCEDIKPHSELGLRNNLLVSQDSTISSTQTFCHFQSDDFDNVQPCEIKKLPKTLVCHDLANGYHDDCYVDGTCSYDAYTFYNWAGIDIFCYFSHHLVTIPPLGWINVGHAHGVKVIGTFITEWEDGRAFWDKILTSTERWKELASLLVATAKTLKFDGWLLNIENEIKQPKELLEFVGHLHAALHRELDEPVLIWYDSVTIEGHLRWQNGLSPKNKDFFDACDGIFTNYSWSEREVRASRDLAGDRLADVYVGIDVWGRNFYGGGQFNTELAVKVPYNYGCSLAIFAPAWTHEAIPDEGQNQHSMDKYEQFLLRDRAFWASIWYYLNTKLPNALPFQTSFCRGQGLKRRLYGEVLSPSPWYNLRHMQYQPNSNHGPHGYILTTATHINNLSQGNILVDDNGIPKYRESLNEFPVEEVTDEAMKPEDGIEKSDLEAVEGLAQNLPGSNITNTEELHCSVVTLSQRVCLNDKIGKKHIVLAQVPLEQECLELSLDDSFKGGSCLKVNSSDVFSERLRMIRLFHCDFVIENSLLVCIATKTLAEFKNQFLDVYLSVNCKDGSKKTIVLMGGNSAPSDNERIEAVSPAEGNQLTELQKYILTHEPAFYTPIDNAFGWTVRYFETLMPQGCVSSISCKMQSAGSILLGYFGLCSKKA